MEYFRYTLRCFLTCCGIMILAPLVLFIIPCLLFVAFVDWVFDTRSYRGLWLEGDYTIKKLWERKK